MSDKVTAAYLPEQKELKGGVLPTGVEQEAVNSNRWARIAATIIGPITSAV